MELKKLKVVTTRMAGYTGVLGPARFKDGVSEEYLPRHIRDRMAASMEFTEVDVDGNEQPAGAQYRMISETRERAPAITSLVRQTEAEKAHELASAAVVASKAPVLETRASLETIAEKLGIKGLREIGSKWNVKHRSIPTLIEMILDAQERSLAARDKRFADKLAREAEALALVTPTVVAPDNLVKSAVPGPEFVGYDPTTDVSEKTATAADAISDELKAAAATGDLSAAISTEE